MHGGNQRGCSNSLRYHVELGPREGTNLACSRDVLEVYHQPRAVLVAEPRGCCDRRFLNDDHFLFASVLGERRQLAGTRLIIGAVGSGSRSSHGEDCPDRYAPRGRVVLNSFHDGTRAQAMATFTKGSGATCTSPRDSSGLNLAVVAFGAIERARSDSSAVDGRPLIACRFPSGIACESPRCAGVRSGPQLSMLGSMGQKGPPPAVGEIALASGNRDRCRPIKRSATATDHSPTLTSWESLAVQAG